jgi:hypothetical protein
MARRCRSGDRYSVRRLARQPLAVSGHHSSRSGTRPEPVRQVRRLLARCGWGGRRGGGRHRNRRRRGRRRHRSRRCRSRGCLRVVQATGNAGRPARWARCPAWFGTSGPLTSAVSQAGMSVLGDPDPSRNQNGSAGGCQQQNPPSVPHGDHYHRSAAGPGRHRQLQSSPAPQAPASGTSQRRRSSAGKIFTAALRRNNPAGAHV